MINEKIIVALDFPHKTPAFDLIHQLGPDLKYVKVGMELFYAEGATLVKELKAKELKVFLDLKLHDIPNTVKKALEVLARLKVDMVNVHVAGGLEMMSTACDAYKSIFPEGNLIAVTQLTSTSKEILNNEIGIPGDVEEAVLAYAKLTKKAGLDGVVCSAHEASLLKSEIGSDFLCVTPGIRLSAENAHDQKRVMTPKDAINNGSSYLVVGRDITMSPTPKDQFHKYLKEIS